MKYEIRNTPNRTSSKFNTEVFCGNCLVGQKNHRTPRRFAVVQNQEKVIFFKTYGEALQLHSKNVGKGVMSAITREEYLL